MGSGARSSRSPRKPRRVFTNSLGGLLSKGVSSVSSVMGSVVSSAAPVLASSALNLGTAMGGTMGTAAATSTGASLLGGLGSVVSAIPGWGWAIAGGLAAFAFFKGWGGPSEAELAAREDLRRIPRGCRGSTRWDAEIRRGSAGARSTPGGIARSPKRGAGFILMGHRRRFDIRPGVCEIRAIPKSGRRRQH